MPLIFRYTLLILIDYFIFSFIFHFFDDIISLLTYSHIIRFSLSLLSRHYWHWHYWYWHYNRLIDIRLVLAFIIIIFFDIIFWLAAYFFAIILIIVLRFAIISSLILINISFITMISLTAISDITPFFAIDITSLRHCHTDIITTLIIYFLRLAAIVLNCRHNSIDYDIVSLFFNISISSHWLAISFSDTILRFFDSFLRLSRLLLLIIILADSCHIADTPHYAIYYHWYFFTYIFSIRRRLRHRPS